MHQEYRNEYKLTSTDIHGLAILFPDRAEANIEDHAAPLRSSVVQLATPNISRIPYCRTSGDKCSVHRSH